MPDLPSMPSDISSKWLIMLDRMRTMSEHVVAQNLFDGSIKLIPRAAIGVMTRKVHVKKAYAGLEYDAPARNRIVFGEEAQTLWKLQVNADYFHSMWLKEQSLYNEAIGECRNIKHRVGDVDMSNLDLIQDSGIKQEVATYQMQEKRAESYAGKSREAKEKWDILTAHLKSIAEKVRTQMEIAERDARDRAIAEDEARRELVKRSVKREFEQAKA